MPRCLPTILATAAAVLIAAAPAMAATVQMKDGRTIKADQLFYTYTHLVAVVGGEDLQMLPNGQIKSVDGVPFEQAYWDQKPASVDHIDGPSPSPMAAIKDGAYPLRVGTQRRYNLVKNLTTWVRRGSEMQNRTNQNGSGSVIESVDLGETLGKVTLTETIRERLDNKQPHEVRLTDQIEPRPDGYYLMGQTMEDNQLRLPVIKDSISTPPRLWPNTLSVGQTWIVGPFRRMGLNQVGRMHVIGRESVTVPAGTYPDAFKVQGFGHVFDGVQLLKGGRLVTDHGTLETTTWFVPGLGPVKEEAKLHLHQDYFPATPAGTEIPLVIEEHSTRSLAEFQLGK